MKIIVFLLFAVLTGINCKRRGGPNRNALKEMYFWDVPEFDIPLDRREQALASRSYIPNKNGIHSLGIWRDRMFVSIFRFAGGVASSLNYFSLNTIDKSPVLIPYPSFEANYVNEDPNNQTVSLPSPSSVINTAHFEIDKCNRLWVADSGLTSHFENIRQVVPQAIVIFDLTNDTLIRRKEIDHKCVEGICILPDIVIDFDGDSCEDALAYISDGYGAIIVYSFKKNRMWVVEHSFMKPNPNEKDFELEHLKYVWNFGVFGMAIADRQSNGSERVYFAPLASTNLYSVANRILQDENYNVSKNNDDFQLVGANGQDGQVNTLIYDEETGVLFNAMLEGATVGCWNTRLPYETMSTLHKMSSSIEFYPTDIDIDDHGNLWVTSHLVAFTAYDELPLGKKNMRIFKGKIKQVIAGTKCQVKSKI